MIRRLPVARPAKRPNVRVGPNSALGCSRRTLASSTHCVRAQLPPSRICQPSATNRSTSLPAPHPLVAPAHEDLLRLAGRKIAAVPVETVRRRRIFLCTLGSQALRPFLLPTDSSLTSAAGTRSRALTTPDRAPVSAYDGVRRWPKQQRRR